MGENETTEPPFFCTSFQEVQGFSALETSLRFIPSVVVGIILNVGTGLVVQKWRADRIVIISSLISAASPLLLALINPDWTFWYSAFWAVTLGPLSADGMFFFL